MAERRPLSTDELFLHVVELSPDERAAALRALCDDASRRREVEGLLAAHDAMGGFLEPAPHDTAVDPPMPRQLGDYLLHRRLGRGGWGEVFLAEDRRLGRRVALKLLSPQLADRPDLASRFAQEARAASALDHPHIATVFEAGTVDGTPFLATEFVDGHTLRQVIAESAAPRPLLDDLELLLQVASALAAAHDAGIVHRDIKPDNVILHREGWIKVIDFGIAKRTGEAAGDGLRTATGMVLGTDAYMAPEQQRGLPVDARADVYALGVLAYELRSGHRPRFADGSVDLAPVDEPLRGSLARALAAEPAARFADGRALQAAWREVRAQIQTRTPQRAATPPTPPPPPSRRRRTPWLLAGAVLLASALALVWLSRTTNAAVHALAVLPFRDATDDHSQQLLADGLTDRLIARLSRVLDLRVTSLYSVTARYGDSAADPTIVGRDLDVHAVLVGRLLRDGSDLSVHAELIHTEDGSHLWGARYLRQPSAIGSLEAEIAQALLAHLRPQLTATARSRAVGGGGSHDAEAYRLYLEGRRAWNRRSEAGLRDAITLLQRAVAVDPDYAIAWAGLADCHALLPNYSNADPREAMPAARAAAERALRIDDRLGEAHASLGLVLKDHDWQFAAADAALRRAIELSPSYAPARQWRAECLVALGRFAEATDEAARARQLDPFSRILGGIVGWVHYCAGDAQQAVTTLEEVRALDRAFARTDFFLGRAYHAAGRDADAIAALRRAVEGSGRQVLMVGALAHVLAAQGDPAAADDLLAELQRRGEREHVSPVALALAETGLGRHAAALDHLQRAHADRDAALIYFLRDPLLDALADAPAWVALLRAVGLSVDTSSPR